MMLTSATGNKGFSLVEVLVTLALIGACYISIAKGLIENMHVNGRVEQLAGELLAAKKFFSSAEADEKKNIPSQIKHIEKVEKMGKGLVVNSIEFSDDQDVKLIEFKEVALEVKK